MQGELVDLHDDAVDLVFDVVTVLSVVPDEGVGLDGIRHDGEVPADR